MAKLGTMAVQPAPTDDTRLYAYDPSEVNPINRSKAVTVAAIRGVQNYPAQAGEVGVTSLAYPIGDVRRYGAVGDGVNEDGPAWQNALTSAGAGNSIFGVLSSTFFAPWTPLWYKISQVLNVPITLRRLVGNQAQVRFTREQSVVPTFADSLFNIIGNISGLEVSGIRATYTGTFAFGLSYGGYVSAFWVEDCVDIVFDRCTATGFNRAGLNVATGTGISGAFGYTTRPKVTRCNFSGNRIAGILFGDTDEFEVTLSTFNTNGLASDNGVGYGVAGWAARLPKNTKIFKNNCSFNYRKGIDFHSGTDGLIEGNTLDSNYYYAIYVDSEGGDLGTWTIRDNSIRGMIDHAAQGSQCIYFGSSVAQGVNARATLVVIDGNTFENISESAVSLNPIYLIELEVGTCVAATVRIINTIAKVGKISRFIINAVTNTAVAGAWHDVLIEGNDWNATEVTQTPFSVSSTKNRVVTFKDNTVSVTTALVTGTVLSYGATVVTGNAHTWSGNILNLTSSAPWANDPLLILRSASELTWDNQLNGVLLRDWDGYRYTDIGAAAPTTDFWSTGSAREYNGTKTAGKINGWTCTAAGTPGTWVPTGVFPGTRIAGDSSVTQTVGTHAPTLRYDAAITNNRVVTLDATGAYDGAEFVIIRSVVAAFPLDIGGLFTVRANETGWARVQYVGAAGAWKLMAFGRNATLLFQGTRIAGDASVTQTVGTHPDTLRYDINITANRTVTLDATNATDGDTFTISRTGLGAFTIDVGGLKTLPAGVAAFAQVQWVGSAAAWKLKAYGLL